MKLEVKLDLKNNIVRYKAVNYAIVFFGLVFLLIFAFFTFQAVNTNNLIQEKRDEQTQLQGEISYFNLARKLTANDVERFNTLLLQLIPEQEDYFSIIASLERLSLYTGLDVTRYSIDLPEEGSEKYTLSIVGTVPPAVLPLFLANYQYGTGRLVTIENMTVNNNSTDNVSLVLSFYSKEIKVSNILKVGSLSTDDITLMQGIEQKITQGEQQAKELESLKNKPVEPKQASNSAELSGTPTPTLRLPPQSR